MGFFRRIAGILGLSKDDNNNSNNNQHEVRDAEEDDNNDYNNNQTRNQRPKIEPTNLPRKGFGVPVKVAVERPQQGPILVPCVAGDGGVQGLKWYTKHLKVDEDGDVADEFLDEVPQETTSNADQKHKSFPRFQIKYTAKPAHIKNQVMSPDGKIQQCLEWQGRLQWV